MTRRFATLPLFVLVGLLAACSSEDSKDSAEGSTGGAASGGSTNTGGAASGGTSNSGGTNNGSGGTQNTGDGPVIGPCAMFPADNPWNTDISQYPLHENSDAFIDSIGRDTNLHPDFGTEWEGAPIGIPYVLVTSAQAKVDVTF